MTPFAWITCLILVLSSVTAQQTSTRTSTTSVSIRTSTTSPRFSTSTRRTTTTSSTRRTSTTSTRRTSTTSTRTSTTSTRTSTTSTRTSTTSTRSTTSTSTSTTSTSTSTTPTSTSTTTSVSTTSTSSSTTSTSTTSTPATATGAATVDNTILILGRDAYSCESVSLGLQGYGIPFEIQIVPQAGIQLPVLNDTATHGRYGGIVIVSEVAYSYTTGWSSAINATQWAEIFAYQSNFGVRMVRLDAFPTEADFGATTAIAGAGCCDTGVEQLIKISDASGFPTANIKTGAGVSTQGLWHYPATITNTTIAKAFATFDAAGSFTSETVAGVINDFGTRKQMVFFISWATQWSTTCNFLQHSYIHWMTRGLFVGRRKVYLSTQVDDMHLSTGLYYPNNTEFRIRPQDLDLHKTWQASLNSRLPAGSRYQIEVGHNGNGDIISATDGNGNSNCNPNYAVDYEYPPDTPLEFQKPLGTGTDLWSSEWTTYPWSLTCAKIDPVLSWFVANRDVFAHVSHTFTHEELNNATYHDAALEIQFNQAWMAQVGISASPVFSQNGLIPPAITGLHNGDVIKAWMDNGLKYVVGDNTRPVLRATESQWHARITNVVDNGYDGLVIIPRWATTIYYNCDTPECTLREWIATSAGSGDFSNLLLDAKTTNTRYLLGLHPDPYMFHQANMRVADMPTFTVGSVTQQMSIMQIWVETMAQEMMRLTNWPILSLKHDDIGQLFVNRKTLDDCTPNLMYELSEDRQTITGVKVTANGNACSVPVPVTFPGTATTSGTATSDKLGSEPLIMWTTLSGSAVEYSLGAPVTV